MKLHEDKIELLCCRTQAAKTLSGIKNYNASNGTVDKTPLVKDLGVS